MSRPTDKSTDLGSDSTLSFIDVITCGFGAAIILMMVYSTLPRMGENIAQGGKNSGSETTAALGIPGLAPDKEGDMVALRVVEVRPIDAAHRFDVASLTATWSGPLTRECDTYRDLYDDVVVFVLLCAGGLPINEVQTLDLHRDAGAVPVRVRARAYQGPWNPLTPSETAWHRLPAAEFTRAVTFELNAGDGKRVRYRTTGGSR